MRTPYRPEVAARLPEFLKSHDLSLHQFLCLEEIGVNAPMRESLLAFPTKSGHRNEYIFLGGSGRKLSFLGDAPQTPERFCALGQFPVWGCVKHGAAKRGIRFAAHRSTGSRSALGLLLSRALSSDRTTVIIRDSRFMSTRLVRLPIHNAPGSNNRATNEAGLGCRIPQCTRKSRRALRLALRNPHDEPVPFSANERSFP